MFSRTGAAERTGAWELPIWTLCWIEEKANVGATAGGEKTADSRQSRWTSGRTEERASAAG